MYYNKCPECGANLDPGEECDCTVVKIAIKKAPEKVEVSSGANAEDSIHIAISLYYENNKKSSRKRRK